jgi:hypothetical protein
MGSVNDKKLKRVMKTLRLQIILVYLLTLGIACTSMAYSQSSPPTPTCVICGGKNGVHSTTCRYYNPPAGKSNTGATGVPGSMQQLNMLIDLFNTPVANKEVEAKKEAARKEANEAKRREAILKQERHDREMKTFKPLEGDPNGVSSDTKSNPDLTLKPLPQSNAPLTMEERERQNLLKHDASVTWNYEDFSAVSQGNTIPDPAPETRLSENEKLINEVIGLVESNGGRMAAITGRYIINVKDGVMNYLDDAAYAVTSGNSYVMQETGEFDVKKITTNALYKTANQTARVYYENATEAVKSRLTDEGIGILKSASINKMSEYKYFDNLSKAWKQTH